MLDALLTLAAPDPSTVAARRGMGMIGIIAIIGFLVVFGLALTVALRRGRRARERAAAHRAAPIHHGTDAWSEAGRRVDPDEGDDFIAGYDTGEFGPPDDGNKA